MKLLPLIVLILPCVSSFPTFRLRIPNGLRVPMPCKLGEIWAGVGHFRVQGTGERNPFGRDFELANYTWTVDLCRKDSDGDGLYNGQELGDPDCVWEAGEESDPNAIISHPGICDPFDFPSCYNKTVVSSEYQNQRQWMQAVCVSGELDCPAMNATGVQTLALDVNNGTAIPAKVTTYECQIFNMEQMGIPTDQDFHVIAFTPNIRSQNILHHIALYACTDDTPATPQPFECGMVPSRACINIIHIWTVGMNGQCLYPECGIRLGRTGYRVIGVQLHWNNQESISGLTDSSGITLHYTPELRRYDCGVMMIGNQHFYLPPKMTDVSVEGECTRSCTNSNWVGNINITQAFNHMHYAGYRMSIEVVKENGSSIFLTDDDAYRFDSPRVIVYKEPIVIEPGVALLTHCGYNTLNRNTTTPWGEATSQEMCFGFISYYPKQNVTVPNCLDNMGISTCNPASLGGCTNLDTYLQNVTTTDAYQDLKANCRRFSPCQDKCLNTIVHLMTTDKCMQGKVWKYIQDTLAASDTTDGNDFLGYIASCKVETALALSRVYGDNKEENCKNMNTYIKAVNTTDAYRDLALNCRRFSPCYTECIDTIIHYRTIDPCLQGNCWRTIQRKLAAQNTVYGNNFLGYISSCAVEVALKDPFMQGG